MAVCALPINAQTIDTEKGYISINKSVSEEIAPNQAEIYIGVETSDKLVKKASEDNKFIANQIASALKKSLGPNDYIKTSNYSITPIYVYTKEHKRILNNYTVSNIIIVKTKNINLVSNLIDTATEKGATRIDNLKFSATDYDSICNSSMAKITKDLYIQADTIAKSINSQILGIKSINATCNQEGEQRPIFAMMSKAVSSESASTPIESGKIKIFVNVNASFYVK